MALKRAVIATTTPHAPLPDAIMKPIHAQFINRLAKTASLADLKATEDDGAQNQQAGYCRGMIAMMHTVANLPLPEAGAVIRAMLSEK